MQQTFSYSCNHLVSNEKVNREGQKRGRSRIRQLLDHLGVRGRPGQPVNAACNSDLRSNAAPATGMTLGNCQFMIEANAA